MFKCVPGVAWRRLKDRRKKEVSIGWPVVCHCGHLEAAMLRRDKARAQMVPGTAQLRGNDDICVEFAGVPLVSFDGLW